MAMHDEDDRPTRTTRAAFEALKLDDLGVVELETYLEDLRREIARVEVVVTRRRGDRSAADAIFGRSGA